jgi:hypothetical protein
MNQEHHHESIDELSAEERSTAAVLERERPVPRPGFRGDLRRLLLGTRRGSAAGARWWILSGSYLGAGLLCLASALFGVAGVGPFAA